MCDITTGSNVRGAGLDWYHSSDDTTIRANPGEGDIEGAYGVVDE